MGGELAVVEFLGRVQSCPCHLTAHRIIHNSKRECGEAGSGSARCAAQRANQ
jgi:hypothetical protein